MTPRLCYVCFTYCPDEPKCLACGSVAFIYGVPPSQPEPFLFAFKFGERTGFIGEALNVREAWGARRTGHRGAQ